MASLPFVSFILLWHLLERSKYCTATDTLSQAQKISVAEILTSAGGIFELGFFSPGNSGKQYVGIWYSKISVQKIVWVANRESPADSASSLVIGGDGNLRLVDGNQNLIWSTNLTISANSSALVLLDKGNLVLKDGTSGESLWESFRHPCDTALPGMKLGLNYKTGEKLFLSSWLAEDDPSPASFVSGISVERPPQAVIWKGALPFWRSGQWNGLKFDGLPNTNSSTGWFLNGFNPLPQTQPGDIFFTFNPIDKSRVRLLTLTPTGALRLIEWDEGSKKWTTLWNTLESPCDIYGTCGPFGVCNKNKSPICRCLKGFVPKLHEEWRKGNWTSGCVRQTELFCGNNTGNRSSASGKTDGFWKFEGVKLPDHSTYVPLDDAQQCKLWCLNNCSCLAYAFVTGIGCNIWTRSLLDIQEFSVGGEQDLFLRLARSELGKSMKRTKLIVSLTVAPSIIIFGAILYAWCSWKARQRGKRNRRRKRFNFSSTFRNLRFIHQEDSWRNKQEDSSDLPIYEFDKIVAATSNFCSTNILGEGGFGPVFKGVLEDGQVVAVKKLSRFSGQGIEEFKNEIILISKLQHRNLVRLFGCCIEGDELMIVYEYMPNSSLDNFLFDSTRRAQLDWAKRFNIIQGIARGLVYLHRDSCLKIIHRDLKASNILLDKDMNPKISDFGLARIFHGTQELANTQRVVGTYGYMSPEYALGGIFSEKSDVFSFGVLLLEIVSGRKNTSFVYQNKCLSLLGYAWQLWDEKSAVDFVDPELADSCVVQEVLRCIHVGLLCVQDQAADRPTMPNIVRMLNSDMDAPDPNKPTFTFRSLFDSGSQLQSSNFSINDASTSVVEGR